MFSTRIIMLAVFPLLFAAKVSGQPLIDQLRDDPREKVQQPEAEKQELPAPGYLGAILDDRQQADGIIVLEVVPDGPAAQGGLQKSDLITSINRKPVRAMNDLAQFITNSAAGKKLDFEVTRPATATKPETPLALEITLGVRPPRAERRFPEFGKIPDPPPREEGQPESTRESPGLLGVRAIPLDRASVVRLRVPVARGAVVVAVNQGSPAEQAGLPRDAVIVAINNRAIDSPTDLARRVQLAGPGAQIELAYYFRDQLFRRKVTLASPTREPGDRQPGSELPLPERRSTEPLSLEQRVEQLEAEVRELRRLLESR